MCSVSLYFHSSMKDSVCILYRNFHICIEFLFQALEKKIDECPDEAEKEKYSVIKVTADVS